MAGAARIVFVTTSPDAAPTDPLLHAALAQLGIEAIDQRWNDPAAQWCETDLLIAREIPEAGDFDAAFFAWARERANLHNPADLLAWNLDKHYLAELGALGVPIVPTIWMEPGRDWSARVIHTRLPAQGEFVVKPARGSSMHDVARYNADDAYMRRTAIDQALTLLAQGTTVMVQRYLPAVDVHGEVSVIFLDGIYSHAALRDAQLLGSDDGPGADAEENARAFQPTSAQIDVGLLALRTAMAIVPGWESRSPLYARVDLISGPDGAPMVLELDVAEAELFTQTSPESAARTAAALARHV